MKLAQGDDQVVRTLYKVPSCANEEVLEGHLRDIVRNNDHIMDGVVGGSTRMGLILNRDETLQSAEILCYGKKILFRGNLLPPECKVFARTTSASNDQIPSFANILSTVSTNSLTMAQHNEGIKVPTEMFAYFSCLSIAILYQFNYILKRRAIELDLDRSDVWWRLLYLDPSIGGITGTSLTRFLIRQFHDPVAEALSFWKGVYQSTQNQKLKNFAGAAGHPSVEPLDFDAFEKLMEDPTSLNLPKGLSAATALKDAVLQSLIDNVDQIKNQLFKDAILAVREENQSVLSFLMSIKPMFPRFLSEFKAATFLGIATQLVGVFQNSRTIRRMFQKKFSKRINLLVIDSERRTLSSTQELPPSSGVGIWDCSATQADSLRERSWGGPVVGATVPHPFEYLNRYSPGGSSCGECFQPPFLNTYTSVSYPRGFSTTVWVKGPLQAYLGSQTSESTTLFHHWEKDTELPLIQKAGKLRRCVGWFVEAGGPVCKALYSNLMSLTGLDWSEDNPGFRRTGCALHRFRSSRVSAGGFISVSPSAVTRSMVTSDTMTLLNGQNHDFMFQPGMLYGQLQSLEINTRGPSCDFSHHHISCEECIRPVSEIWLQTEMAVDFGCHQMTVQNMLGRVPTFL